MGFSTKVEGVVELAAADARKTPAPRDKVKDGAKPPRDKVKDLDGTGPRVKGAAEPRATKSG